MDVFEQKYGFAEDENTVKFHRSRRMFCVYREKLIIAEPNLSYSHAVWFTKEGWMSHEDDDLIKKITRGIVDEKGDVYFYRGYNFEINERAELDFFTHIAELTERLKLKQDSKIFGGLIKQSPGKIWPPIKEYGKVSDNI